MGRPDDAGCLDEGRGSNALLKPVPGLANPIARSGRAHISLIGYVNNGDTHMKTGTTVNGMTVRAFLEQASEAEKDAYFAALLVYVREKMAVLVADQDGQMPAEQPSPPEPRRGSGGHT